MEVVFICYCVLAYIIALAAMGPVYHEVDLFVENFFKDVSTGVDLKVVNVLAVIVIILFAPISVSLLVGVFLVDGFKYTSENLKTLYQNVKNKEKKEAEISQNAKRLIPPKVKHSDPVIHKTFCLTEIKSDKLTYCDFSELEDGAFFIVGGVLYKKIASKIDGYKAFINMENAMVTSFQGQMRVGALNVIHLIGY